MIQEVIARLKSEVPDLIDVLPAEEIDAIAKATAPKSATAFVLPYREKAEPNTRATGGHLQYVAVQFLVAIFIRRYDARGGERVIEFDDLKTSIENALAGWEPSEDADPVELVGGQAAPLGNGRSVYVQTWQTSRYLSGA
nr:hypothetical protein [uncultured Cohaesibacter sp.]